MCHSVCKVCSDSAFLVSRVPEGCKINHYQNPFALAPWSKVCEEFSPRDQIQIHYFAGMWQCDANCPIVMWSVVVLSSFFVSSRQKLSSSIQFVMCCFVCSYVAKMVDRGAKHRKKDGLPNKAKAGKLSETSKGRSLIFFSRVSKV